VGEQVKAWLEVRSSMPTLVWMAMEGELDLGPVVQALADREWLTTRTPSSGPLTVHPYFSQIEVHRFGFRQPVAGSEQVVPEDIGVVLVPGLVFDRQGGRLGWGAGYYDRLLARCNPDVPRVGVTLERWLEDRLPQEPHDIPMTHLITDRRVREIV
jgi:5-formyltetrahydrofolate cyclo-ligase